MCPLPACGRLCLQAYRKLAKAYHPDKVSAAEKEASEAKFRDIAEAYEVCCCPSVLGAVLRLEGFTPQAICPERSCSMRVRWVYLLMYLPMHIC